MPAAIPIVVALATAGGATAAAAINSKTQKDVADKQVGAQKDALASTTAANDKALAFQQAQAENSYQNNEVTRKANYDQWVAKQQQLQGLDRLIGNAPRAIPAYAPGVDPMLTPASAQASPVAAPPVVPPSGGNYQATFNQITGGKPLDQNGLLALAPQLKAAGFQITPPSAGGVVSKIGTPDGQWVRVLNGDTSVASPTVWVPQPGGGAAPSIGQLAAASPRPNYAMPGYMAPSTPLSLPSIGSFGY